MRAPTRAATRPPHEHRLAAIDFAVDELEVESFADLDMGQPLGTHALYAIGKPAIRRGVLLDARRARPRDQLLTAIEHCTEHPGLRVIDRDPFDPATVVDIGHVDALFLFNLLLHAVAPDWDRVLELYAPSASCLVIGNPQWRAGGRTIRMIDLGREGFLGAVPASERHRLLFDRLDEWHPTEMRPHRDATTVWQWGITDAGLTAKLDQLGFRLQYERSHGSFPGADAFVSKTFVFVRPDRPVTSSERPHGHAPGRP